MDDILLMNKIKGKLIEDIKKSVNKWSEGMEAVD